VDETPPTIDEINQSLYGNQGKKKHNAHPRSEESKRTADGIVFDSIPEMERWQALSAMQRRGLISKLQYQPLFNLIVNGVHICKYSPDFTYLDERQKVVTEDVKGFKKSKKTGKMLPRVNREFHIKVKLMKALFDLDVIVV